MIHLNSFTQRIIEEKIISFPDSLINEGLISSTSYEKTNNILTKLFEKNNKDVEIEYNHLGIIISAKNDVFNEKLYTEFLSILKVCGYVISYFFYNSNYILKYKRYPTIIELTNFKNDDYLEINLIKRFDTSDDSPIPDKLYHITEKQNLSKILKNGLIPKSKKKIENHPDRIYILNNIDGAYNFLNLLNNMYPEKNFSIIEIDIKLINQIKLYFDPTYFKTEKLYKRSKFKAYYTYDNIPPYACNIVETLKKL